MRRAVVIGIVGAESSGKTALAHELHAKLVEEQNDAVVVGEALREFCVERGRTPRQTEQAQIASEQSWRITAAAKSHAVVVADTTALMIAVYSDFVFGDTSLYAQAEREHQRCDLTLLTALDLPWRSDGVQRDGPYVREPVDALIRAAIQRSAQSYAVVAGVGDARLQSVWAVVQHTLPKPDEPEPNKTYDARGLTAR